MKLLLLAVVVSLASSACWPEAKSSESMKVAPALSPQAQCEQAVSALPLEKQMHLAMVADRIDKAGGPSLKDLTAFLNLMPQGCEPLLSAEIAKLE